MLFTEYRFLLFFGLVFVLHWSLSGERARKLLLLGGSWLFYAGWEPKFLGLIIATTVVDYLIGGRIAASTEQPRRLRWLWLSIAWNLGMLGFFKYCNFFIDSGQVFLGWLGLHTSVSSLNIILPAGISFFTFQSMSYSIDIYRKQIQPTRSFLDFATFIAFFPQLFAGPIVRAADFLPQLETRRRLADVAARSCLVMFLIGFIKKAVFADNLAPVADAYFAAPAAASTLGAWTGILAYAGQIYCDFSGYSDMAIACAGLLGYRFCQNFAAPYLSLNITDFWRRWHMSLSSWLRDYLYIPLGGNRGGTVSTYRNLMATMVLGGLWHGAAWTFIVWGFLHGLALIVHKEWTKARTRLKLPAMPAPVALALTFWWVCLAWIFFRATSFSDALVATRAWVLLDSPGAAPVGIACLVVLAVLALLHAVHRGERLTAWSERVPGWAFAPAYGVVFACALAWVPTRYQAFIYFQF